MIYNKVYVALIMSFGVALTLSSNQAFGGSGASDGGRSGWTRSTIHPSVDVTKPISGDVHYTCTLDLPWDWVHRCPSPSEPPSEPVVIPSVPGCPEQHVTVSRGDGKEQSVTIVRCP